MYEKGSDKPILEKPYRFQFINWDIFFIQIYIQ